MLTLEVLVSLNACHLSQFTIFVIPAAFSSSRLSCCLSWEAGSQKAAMNRQPDQKKTKPKLPGRNMVESFMMR